MTKQEASLEQATRGRRQYCPRCKQPQQTYAGRPYKFGEPEHRCFKSEKFEDIQWFRRVRICSVCGPHFITAELDERLVTELVKSRDQLGAYARQRVEVVRSSRAWLNSRTETIPRELAARLIRASAWWHTHSSGSPVQAPRHADRMTMTRQGWAVDFGANYFLAGKAVERCRSVIFDALEDFAAGKPWSRTKLMNKLKTAVAWSVANYNLDEYESYPLTGNDMMFGAQSIDVEHAAQFIIRESGILEFLR